MAMPETDKALARLLQGIPALIFALFIAALILLPSQRKHALELEKVRSEARKKSNGQATNPGSTPSTIPNTTLPHPPPLTASHHTTDTKHHLLLCATGSVATIKLPNILHSLSQHPALSIRILLTPSATTFLQSQSPEQPSLPSLLDIPNVEAIYRDEDEWIVPWTRGAPILHIELRRWADLMVIAPLSANSLAKVALGMSSDLISSVVRAWDSTGGLIDKPRPGIALPYGDGERKGIMVAPAMNTAMWNHPVTARHMKTLEEWSVERGGWVEILRPIEKDLACGDLGGGAMMEWRDIVKVVEERLGLVVAAGEEEYVAVEGEK